MSTSTQTKKWQSRFPATWDGFHTFRKTSGNAMAETTEAKWKPIVLRLEALRELLFGARAWGDIDAEEVAYELMTTLYSEVTGRGGSEPSTNTLRGRYDACKAYFEFLRLSRRIDRNPLGLLARPSSKAKDQPYLTPDEDEKLAALPKEGHHLAIWALARGHGLREGEICDLDDEDVNLKQMRIHVRDGKTRAALRTIPIIPSVAPRLAEYRRWRDKHVRSVTPTTRFMRTRSGSISKGYVWKLVKELARKAEVGIVTDERTKKPVLTDEGEPVTRITPHALRRTFGSALVESGVLPLFVYPIFGHKSERVFHESYCKITPAVQFERVILAAGTGPLALQSGIDDLEEELSDARAQAALNADEALARVAALRAAAEELERTLSSATDRRKAACTA